MNTEPTTAPKLCINCRHYLPSQLGTEYAKCIRTKRECLDLVSGVKTDFLSFCQTQRDPNYCLIEPGPIFCGPEGRHFEPKTEVRP